MDVTFYLHQAVNQRDITGSVLHVNRVEWLGGGGGGRRGGSVGGGNRTSLFPIDWGRKKGRKGEIIMNTLRQEHGRNRDRFVVIVVD